MRLDHWTSLVDYLTFVDYRLGCNSAWTSLERGLAILQLPRSAKRIDIIPLAPVFCLVFQGLFSKLCSIIDEILVVGILLRIPINYQILFRFEKLVSLETYAQPDTQRFQRWPLWTRSPATRALRSTLSRTSSLPGCEPAALALAGWHVENCYGSWL